MEKVYAIRVLWGAVLLLFLSVGLNAAFFFRHVWTSPSRSRSLAQKLTLMAFVLGTFFLACEYFFSRVYVKTDVANFTYSSKAWFREHWVPINKYRYRDSQEKKFDGRKVAFIVGDSFVAGYGIEDVKDRFANLVGNGLGEDWEFVVIARNGWDTPQQVGAMYAYPELPDLIILSHYLNDIVAAADAMKIPRPHTIQKKGPLPAFLSRNSFFLSWVHWKLLSRGVGSGYWEYLKANYTDPAIWGKHEATLRQVFQFGRESNAPVCMVLWPNLRQMEDSREMMAPVAALAEQEGAVVVDMSDELADLPSRKLVVSSMDNHPNQLAHKRAADAILKAVSDLPVVKGTP